MVEILYTLSNQTLDLCVEGLKRLKLKVMFVIYIERMVLSALTSGKIGKTEEDQFIRLINAFIRYKYTTTFL